MFYNTNFKKPMYHSYKRYFMYLQNDDNYMQLFW